MIGGRRVDVHKSDVTFAQKIHCRFLLVAHDPVAISKLNRQRIIDELLDQRCEFAQLMFSRRKRWRKLQQKYTEFSSGPQDRYRPQKAIEKSISQRRRSAHLP